MAIEHGNSNLEKIGKIIGVLFSYAVFLTVFYFAFRLTNRITSTFTFWHILLISLTIVLVATLIRVSLK